MKEFVSQGQLDRNKLVAGLQLRVWCTSESLRAELVQQTPGGTPYGRLVWQHNRPIADETTAAVALCASTMEDALEYLVKRAFPGVAF